MALDPNSALPCSLLDDAWAKSDLGLTLCTIEEERKVSHHGFFFFSLPFLSS